MNRPIKSLLESLLEKIKGYATDRLELLKLKIVDKTSSIISAIITSIALIVIFFIFIIVFNIGIALLISEFTGKAYQGFLIVAGFYVIAGIILFTGRGTFIKSAITGVIIRKIYKNAKPKNK